MFDKLYKEANDSIPVNQELLECLKCEAAKEKKEKPYGFIYRYGYIAAAIVLVTVSLNVLPRLINNRKDTGTAPGTTNDSVISDVVNTPQTPANFTDDKTDITENVSPDTALNDKKSEIPADNTVVKKAGNTPRETVSKKKETAPAYVEKGEATVAKESPITESVLTDDIKPSAEGYEADKQAADPEIIPQVSEHNAVSEESKAIEGKGEQNILSAGRMRSRTEVMITTEEYCSYFGFEPEGWKIPEGMAVVDSNSFCIGINAETGEYDNQSCVLEYSGGDKRITITLVPQADMVSDRIKSSIGKKYRENCVIEEHGELFFSIYLVKNGRGYIIETQNEEKENVYQLIDSIT